jgi:adenylate cyclase
MPHYFNKMHKLQLIAISFITVLMGCLAYGKVSFLNSLELKTIDLRFSYMERFPPDSSKVVFAVVDGKSIAKEGKWVWSGKKIADLITKLSVAGAKVIVFDIGFLEQYAPISPKAESTDSPLFVEIEEYGIKSIKIGELPVPVIFSGNILVNFRGGEKSFSHITKSDIPNGNFSPKKIVLVGVKTETFSDIVNCPFGIIQGVKIHANFINSILMGKFINQPVFDIYAIIFTGLFLGIVLIVSGTIPDTIVGISIISGYITFCWYMLVEKGLILNLAYPLSVMIIISLSITTYRYVWESKQKKFLTDAFSSYLAPSVVKTLIKNQEKLILGGERRIITPFFSDVQYLGYLPEKYAPDEIVGFLNEYLTEMTDIILDHQGTVDKFDGDAIIAIFGAPNDIKNQAETACVVCIKMHKRLLQLREEWEAQGKPNIMMRIGLCTGPAIVGNMGSRNRMDYTMLGDTVNMAARLERLNKVYGTDTVISETTYKEAVQGNQIETRELDLLHIVGQREPMRIYQLIGFHDDCDTNLQKTIDIYKKGLNSYRSREWYTAADLFQEALTITPDDAPSKTMLARCEKLKLNPLGKDWDGSYTMRNM